MTDTAKILNGLLQLKLISRKENGLIKIITGKY